MKKTLTILIIIFIIFLLSLFLYLKFFGTNSQNSTLHQSQQSDTIYLRFGHNTPEDSALHEASLRFAKKIETLTNKKVKIEVFPAQQLGNDHQMVEMAREGNLDIILTPTAKMSVPVPSMQYADLPFFFPTRQDLYDMLDGEPGEMILDDMKSIGLIGVTFWENGFKHITANSPIKSPTDFKDKTIRVMKSRIIIEQFESFGAKAVPIDFHETKKALSDGVVDGQENPLIAIASMGFYEVQSDLTLSEHAFLGYVLSLSEKSMSKLPNRVRALLIKTAKEVTPWEREETQKREQKLLEMIAASGVDIHTLTQESRKEFSRLVAHIPEQFEYEIGVNVISKTQELLYEKYGMDKESEEHFLLGINVDASVSGELAALEIKRGVMLAVEEINAKGGVLGKPLKVLLKDHKVMPSLGIQNIKHFAQYPNLVAIVGGKHSPVIVGEAETISELKVPYLVPFAAAERVVNNGYDENYVFRVSANDAKASRFIVKHTLENHSHPAIIVENSVWGRESLKSMKEYMRQRGLQFSQEIVFNRGQRSFEAELQKILHSQAESIILVADASEGNRIVKEIANLEKKLPVISHWGIIEGDFFEENKKILAEMDFTVFQTFSFEHNQNKLAQKLLQRYKKKYKAEEIKIDHAVAQAYDVTKIIALAMKHAKSSDRTDIKTALESLGEYRGVVKNYNPPFSATNHEAMDEDDFFMAKFNTSGSMVRITQK